jgi:hypothetical protein
VNDPLLVSDREKIEDIRDRAKRGVERERSFALEALAQRAPDEEELHDEERSAVLHDVVVEHRDRAGMGDCVRHVPFSEEALDDLLLEQELGPHAL